MWLPLPNPPPLRKGGNQMGEIDDDDSRRPPEPSQPA